MLFIPEKLVLTRDGVWLSNGEEITHEGTLRAFYRSVIREGKQWFLQIGWEKVAIEVQDTGYFVSRVELHPESNEMELTLRDGRKEMLRGDTIQFEEPGRLTVLLQNGDQARFTRAAFHQMMEYLECWNGNYVLNFPNGEHVVLAKA